jgi:mycothiol synthase
MGGLTWRTAIMADAASLAELFSATELATPTGLETDPEEILARLSMPRLILDRDAVIGTDASGMPMAYAEAADMGVGQGVFRIRLTAAVHPARGEQDMRAALDWLLQRAGELRRERSPDLPAVLGTRCAAADHVRMTALEAAGFQIARWDLDLVRAVAEPLFTSARAAGIQIMPYDSGYEEDARVAHNDAYADEPAALLPSQQDWPGHAIGLANFRPDASFLALADDSLTDSGSQSQDIAGFLFSLERKDSAGVREGIVHCLGIRSSWRRRGLATTLIAHALQAYRVIGYSTARLQVLDTNTGAVRLYGKLGFTDSGRGFAMLQTPTL